MDLAFVGRYTFEMRADPSGGPSGHRKISRIVQDQSTLMTPSVDKKFPIVPSTGGPRISTQQGVFCPLNFTQQVLPFTIIDWWQYSCLE